MPESWVLIIWGEDGFFASLRMTEEEEVAEPPRPSGTPPWNVGEMEDIWLEEIFWLSSLYMMLVSSKVVVLQEEDGFFASLRMTFSFVLFVSFVVKLSLVLPTVPGVLRG